MFIAFPSPCYHSQMPRKKHKSTHEQCTQGLCMIDGTKAWKPLVHWIWYQWVTARWCADLLCFAACPVTLNNVLFAIHYNLSTVTHMKVTDIVFCSCPLSWCTAHCITFWFITGHFWFITGHVGDMMCFRDIVGWGLDWWRRCSGWHGSSLIWVWDE